MSEENKYMLNDGTITQNELVNFMLEDNANPTINDVLDDLITQHERQVLPNMQTGYDYYHNNNDIKDRKITYYQNGAERVDETAVNNKLSHNWQKLLVKQKMGYMVGKPMTFANSEADEGNSPNDEFLELINNLLGEDWDDTINELVKGASNKGVEWLHPYIDNEGNFQYTIIDARECIPIWETSKQNKLQAMIRYYTMMVRDDERIRVEYWTDNNVTYYLEDANGTFRLDTLFVDGQTIDEDGVKDENENVINPRGHFTRQRQFGDEVISAEQEGWGMVPFIPFKNNEEMEGDLNDYKELVDAYDKARSDLANDLEEIQEAIWLLKNYQGQNLSEFQKNLRYYKAINVDGEGDADTITVDIPVEAKKEHLEKLREDIYKFGMGVNVDTDKYGNSPSGVALQFLYSMLDLKCDTLERKFTKSIKHLLRFIALYAKVTDGEEYDPNVVDITFNRSMIVNEKEKVESAQMSKGVIDDQSIYENHPWVDDPAKAMDRAKQQRPVNLDSLEGE